MLTEVTTTFPWCSLQTAFTCNSKSSFTSIYRRGSCGAVRIDTVFRRQCRFCLPGHKHLNPEGESSPPPGRLSIQNTVGGGDNFTDQEIHYQFPQMLCPVLCDTMDCSPPGSSVHGILQARIPEWVAIPFSRGPSQPTDQTQISCTAGRFFTI